MSGESENQLHKSIDTEILRNGSGKESPAGYLVLNYAYKLGSRCQENYYWSRYILVVFRGVDISSSNHQNGAAKIFTKN